MGTKETGAVAVVYLPWQAFLDDASEEDKQLIAAMQVVANRITTDTRLEMVLTALTNHDVATVLEAFTTQQEATAQQIATLEERVSELEQWKKQQEEVMAAVFSGHDRDIAVMTSSVIKVASQLEAEITQVAAEVGQVRQSVEQSLQGLDGVATSLGDGIANAST